MPAVPEVGHTVRLIGRIEVDREAESQQKAMPMAMSLYPEKSQ